MPRALVTFWAIWTLLPVALSAGTEASGLVPVAEAPIPAAVHEVLENYCHSCHEAEESRGGIDLSLAANAADVYLQGRTWNKVLRVVQAHEMPPHRSRSIRSGTRTADDVDRKRFRDAACAAQTEPGRITVRRLNRTEYQNTLRDLFGQDVDAARDLPQDPAGDGFDNQGDTLFIPPVLMEKYLDTTKRILTDVRADDAPGLARRWATKTDENISVAEAARNHLESFLPAAFRRPVASTEIDVRVQLVSAAIARGESFEQGMANAMASALLSPYFLFRVEQDQAPEGSTEAYLISDHELAVRLSYFLWSTMPDEELTRVADEGRLHDPGVLRSQVERMLADPKSVALAEDFAAQWFGYRDMRSHEMDIRRFGEFNGVRGDMYNESRAFFDALFRENRPVLNILDCDYAFVNARLAGHYGLAEVEGNDIREVALSDRRRGGVLGMGSTLTVTSYPTRTSPILRGKWILENLLGTPPPPPPPDVKEVSKNDRVKDGLTLRQRLEAHRTQESCASCHAKMDPLGFSLENYDGIGKWRDEDNDLVVDASANLPDGTEFEGPEGLKDVLLARQDLFVRHMTEKMLTYALGRAVDYYDECTARQILDRLATHEYRSHEMILGIVESYPFRHRQSAD